MHTHTHTHTQVTVVPRTHILGLAKSKYAHNCSTPAPTPTPAVPFVAYAESERCLEARPVSSFTNRRRLTGGSVGSLSDPLDDCYQECYAAGLPVPFFFAINDGVCYCCDHWRVG